MATIQPGNFSNIPHQPNKNREARPQDQAPGFQVEDGLVLSGQLPPGVPTPAPATLPGPLREVNIEVPIEVPHKFPVEIRLPVYTQTDQKDLNAFYDAASGTVNFNSSGSNRDILAHEAYEGAFLSGPGVTSGIASINASGQTGAVSEFAFTNGLHSTKFIGLSGNVLADANPFKS